MKTHKNTFAAIACALAASVGHATPIPPTVDVTFDFGAFNTFGYDAVTITRPGSNAITVNAGRFQGSASNVVGVPESIFVDSLDRLFVYCYDIFQSISWGSSTYSISLDGESARTLDFLGAVNTVMSGQGKYNPYAWLHPVDQYQAAAIQLGIWESKYESDSEWKLNGVNDGVFDADGLATGHGKTHQWWNTFRDAIAGSASLKGDYVMVLKSEDFQDMITGDPPTVPEPGSLALLGLGFCGLLWARRRKGSTVA